MGNLAYSGVEIWNFVLCLIVSTSEHICRYLYICNKLVSAAWLIYLRGSTVNQLGQRRTWVCTLWAQKSRRMRKPERRFWRSVLVWSICARFWFHHRVLSMAKANSMGDNNGPNSNTCACWETLMDMNRVPPWDTVSSSLHIFMTSARLLSSYNVQGWKSMPGCWLSNRLKTLLAIFWKGNKLKKSCPCKLFNKMVEIVVSI